MDMEQTYPTAQQMSDTIKAAIAAAGLSQRETAERAGIAYNTLNRRLKGSPITWAELVAIAEVLGRSASSLIAETEVRVAAQIAA